MSQPRRQKFPEVLRHYRLEQVLGAGGMGSAVKGVDRRDGTPVAIKLLHPHLAASDESFRERFEQEAHIAALLRSPCTVGPLDFGVQDGLYFLVMNAHDVTIVRPIPAFLSVPEITPRRKLAG